MLQPIKPTKTKTIVVMISFVLVVIALMTVGSFCDFEISQWITKNSLLEGEYFSDSQFALFVESVGSLPIWLISAFACAILFWLCMRMNKPKWLKVTSGFVCNLLSVFAIFMAVKDTFGYVLEQNGVQDIIKSDYVVSVMLVLSMLGWLTLVSAVKHLKAEPKKLLRLALVIICTVALYSLITLIKSPWGRVRFRTINYLNEPSLFTQWFVVNGKRTFDGLPYDCCKSFPSGHVFSAGIVFTLLSLPYVFEKLNKRWINLLLWTACLLWVGMVAVGRMVAGAHYLTDVVVGGTISMLGALVFRGLFLTNFENLRVLKSR